MGVLIALGVLVVLVLVAVGKPITIYWLQFPIAVMFQLFFTLALVANLSLKF